MHGIIIYSGSEPPNPDNDNVDVEVIFKNNDRYAATFFTVKNIQYLLDTYKITGKCCSGLYMWAADMVIVEKHL